MIVKLMCMTKYFGEDLHYAFMDVKKAEKVLESYDYDMHYGHMAPYLMYFKDGKAYHLQ